MEAFNQFTDKQKEICINRVIKFEQLFKRAGLKLTGRRFKCPFHDGSSESAAIFKDEEGDRLYCFSEEKIYSPVDFVKRGFLDFDVERLFDFVWSELSDAQKEAVLPFMDATKKDADVIPESLEKARKNLQGFKQGKYDYAHFCEIVKLMCEGALQ